MIHAERAGQPIRRGIICVAVVRIICSGVVGVAVAGATARRLIAHLQREEINFFREIMF